MRRILFNEDHQALRATAKEICDRSLVPRMDQFLEENRSTAPPGSRSASRICSG